MNKNVWEAIWDYDPNGLLVIDMDYNVQIVNSALIDYFNLEKVDVIGRKVNEIFDDIQDFVEINGGSSNIKKRIKHYENLNITMSEMTFLLKENDLIVKIFHDVTHEMKRENKINFFKLQIIEEVEKIVDKQMKMGQEIASILGETTAETKSSLIKLAEALTNENLESR